LLAYLYPNKRQFTPPPHYTEKLKVSGLYLREAPAVASEAWQSNLKTIAILGIQLSNLDFLLL